MCAKKVLIYFIVHFCVSFSLGDISHLIPQDYSTIFHQFPTQQIHFLPNYGHPVDGLYVPPVAVATSTNKPTTSTTTEFILPEVVDNRQAKDMENFIPIKQHYLPPSRPFTPPVREDIPYNYEKPTSTTKKPNTIVVFDPSNTWPGYNYEVPQIPDISTPAPIYLPPPELKETPQNLLRNSDFSVNIKEMSCLQLQGGYFRAVLKLNNDLKTHALIESDTDDNRCKLKHLRDTLVVNISETNFKLCGVNNCGPDLCLRIRFPHIYGIRTANDELVTLHCKSQERVAVKIHALQMGVTNDIQSRNLGNYFHGGSQNIFRTNVELLRRTSAGMTHVLHPNEAVPLGENLLLRAHVLPGDGWNYTKLTEVSLQRRSASGEKLNAIELINSVGCMNPTLQSICPQLPKYDPPLGHSFLFKSFMFQGMKSGDEVILSMRITGCLEARDCEIQTQQCHIVPFELSRRKRTITVRNNSEAVSEISLLSFRVSFDNITQEEEFVQEAVENIRVLEHNFALATSLAFVGSLIILAILVHLKFSRLRKH